MRHALKCHRGASTKCEFAGCVEDEDIVGLPFVCFDKNGNGPMKMPDFVEAPGKGLVRLPTTDEPAEYTPGPASSPSWYIKDKQEEIDILRTSRACDDMRARTAKGGMADKGEGKAGHNCSTGFPEEERRWVSNWQWGGGSGGSGSSGSSGSGWKWGKSDGWNVKQEPSRSRSPIERNRSFSTKRQNRRRN
jgi:hypothetical protein